MAYLYDDREKQLPNAVGLGQKPQGVTPEAVAPAQTPGRMATQGGPSSGRFVGFERFFNANRDSAANVGGKLADDVGERARKADAGLKQTQTAFDGQVQQGVVTFRGNEGEDAATQAAKGYTGPKSLDEMNGFQQLSANANRSASEAAALGTAGGQQALLAQQYGQTAPGGGRLDAALTNATTGGRFQQLSQKYGGLAGALESARADALSRVQTAEAWSAPQASAAAAYVAELQRQREEEQRRAAEEAARKAEREAGIGKGKHSKRNPAPVYTGG